MEVIAPQIKQDAVPENSLNYWENIVSELNKKVSLQSLKTWIYPCTPVNYLDGKIILRVPSHFHYEWIESHYGKLIKSIASKVLNTDVELEYVVPPAEKNEVHEITFDGPDEAEVLTQGNVSREDRLNAAPEISIPLFSRFTFDNFIVVKNNKFAKKSAQKVVENIGNTYFNPFYIYAPTGMGKTHLLHAVGNEIIQNYDLKVSYVTSEKFAFEFVSALKEKRVEQFIRSFRNVDVLLMDDIQFLSSKMKMQEEFFHAFNELIQLNKQVVVAADRPPSKLAGYNPSLLSRLQSGLIVDLQLPDYESRLEIIRSRCKQDGVELEPEVMSYIARNIVTNVRELEGIIIRMLAQSSILGEELNLDMVMKIMMSLAPHLKFGKQNRVSGSVSPDEVVNIIAELYAKPAPLIKGPSRKRDVARIRKLAVYCCNKFTDESLTSIAKVFFRSHAFVIYSIRDIEKMLRDEPDLNIQIEKIEKLIFP